MASARSLMPMPRRLFVQRIPGIVMAARFARQKTMPPCCRRWPSCAPWAEAASAAGRGARMMRGVPSAGPNAGAGRPGDLPRALQRHYPGLLMGTKSACCPPHYEGMPLSLIEGMAAGCAVVGNQLVGVQEVVDSGRTDCWWNTPSPTGPADALATLLNRSRDAARMAAAARGRCCSATDWHDDRAVRGSFRWSAGEITMTIDPRWHRG